MRTKMILPVQDETTLAIENLSAQVIALRSQLESAERDRDAAIDLLRRIRASINTNGELSALCMQDIDAMLEEK